MALVVLVASAPAMGAVPVAEVQENDTEGGEADELAPGVDENGSVNTTILYRAHREVLQEEGYRATQAVVVAANGSELVAATVNSTGEADEGNVSLTKTATLAGIDYDVDVWSNETATFARVVSDNETSYVKFTSGPPAFVENESDGRQGPQRGGPMGPQGNGPMGPHDENGVGPHHNGQYHDDGMQGDGSWMQGMMRHGMGPGEMPVPGYPLLFVETVAGNFTVENEATVDNRTVYTLTAPIEVDETVTGNYSGEITLVVDDRGLVSSATVTAESSAYDAAAGYSLDVAEVGVDSVAEPDWLADVPENSTTYGPPTDRPGNGSDGGY